MNGFLVLSAIFGVLALYEFWVSLTAFFRKKPNIGMGAGALGAGFMSGFLGIWVSTFSLAVLDVGTAFIVTMIVMLMACCVREASKEQL